jgi:membrane-bound lytic murein transglycosylase F
MSLPGVTSRAKGLTSVLAVIAVVAIAACNQEPSSESSDELDTLEEPSAPTGPRFADEEPPAPYADLADMRRVGALRVLIHHHDLAGLEREGAPTPPDIPLVKLFAKRLRLPIRWIVVTDRDRLIPALLEGRGDLIAHALTITENRAQQVSFSAPVRSVDEVVVVPQDAVAPPRDAQALVAMDREPKHVPHIRASSAFVDTLEEAARRNRGDPGFQAIPENLAVHEILEKVGVGEYPLTIHDSDEVAAYLSYRSDVKVAFILNKNRSIAWAARPSSERLIDSINSFLFKGDAAALLAQSFGGDLDQIRHRGVLRVAMPNNSSSYFIYRGQALGYQYEMAQRLARSLGVRLQAVAPALHTDMFRLLEVGEVDLIAAVFTITPERQERVDFSEPLLGVRETLVQPANALPITTRDALAGKAIHARRSSSYWTTLEQVAGVRLVAVDEALETETIMDRVAKGDIPLTVADSNILERFLTYRDDVQGSLVLSEAKSLAYSIRKDAPNLLAAVNAFVSKTRDSKVAKRLYTKYFQDEKRIRRLQRTAVKGQISPYDDLIRKYARKYGLDWRLVAAQMFQESGFDPKAKSWAGARGLMQVMPGTAREMGFDPKDLYDPETSIAAGTLYMHRMIKLKHPNLPPEERYRFALASYNAGYGHVLDARKIARTIGKRRDNWFANVEDAIVLLEDPKYWQQARHGFCRGSEPRIYVQNIEKYYDVFSVKAPLGAH